VLGRTYATQNCSAARALEVIGERWSLLIIRDALFRGVTRFSDFQRGLGIAPNILAARLDTFVAQGLMQLERYSDQYDHYEYVLTHKGRELQPVVIALTAWGDRWAAPQGPPFIFQHDGWGGPVWQKAVCRRCDISLTPAEVKTRPGPGARAKKSPPTARAAGITGASRPRSLRLATRRAPTELAT